MKKYKLVVMNSCIIINDYKMGDSPSIEGQFKILDRTTRSFIFIGIYYDENNRCLYLPRGMDIWFLESHLDTNAYVCPDYNLYKETDMIKMKCMPRDERQERALNFMLSRLEFKNNRFKSQLGLSLPTGAGKTYVSIATMACERIRSVVITYSNNWLTQWRKCVLDYTDIDQSEIYKIDGSNSIGRLLSGKVKRMNKIKIFLVTHSTLTSYGNRFGWNRIGDLFKLLEIGLKFYDEAHLNFSSMCMIDFFTNTYRTYYVTATPARSDSDENKIYNLYMKNIPCIDLFDKDNDPHTHYIAFKYNSHPAPEDVSMCRNQYGLNRAAYTNYLVSRPTFRQMLIIVINMAMKMDGKTLFYIGTNDAIGVVYQFLSETFPEIVPDIGIYTSIAGDTKDLAKNKKYILSTTKSAGAAEDIDGLQMTVVLAEPFKSEVLARQTLGRTRANNTFYIELVDLGFTYTKKYYFYKLAIFDKYALSVSHTIFNDYDLNVKVHEIMLQRLNMWYKSVPISFGILERKEAIKFTNEKHRPVTFFDEVYKK